MNCPKCGASVTDEVVFCPYCGQNVTVQPEPPVSPANETPVEEIYEYPQPVQPTEADYAQTEYPQSEPSSSNSFAEVSFDEKPAKRKKKLWKVLIPCVAVVAVLAVVFAIFSGPIIGFFIKTFGSDEAYLKHVEKKALEQYTEDISAAYGTYTGVLDDIQASETEIKVKVSKEALSMLSTMGVEANDLEWINDVVIRSNANMKDGLSESKIALEIGKETVLDLDVLLDMSGQDVYVGIPSLSEEYLKADMDTGSSATLTSLYSSEGLIKALPSEETLNKLLTKYTAIVLDNIDDAEKSSDTLEIGDISQKVTVLEYTIDRDMIVEIARAVLKEAKNDKELKSCIKNMVDFLEDQGILDGADDIYDEYQNGIEDLLDELEDLDYENEDMITIIDYVDNSHNIIGREIEIEGEQIIYYATVTKGKNFAKEIEIDDMVIYGEGTKKGSENNAEYTLEVDGIEMLTVTVSGFDKEASKGKFILTPTGALLEDLDIDSDVASAIETFNLGISYEFSSSTGNASAAIGIVSNEKALAELIITTKTKSASKISLPDADQVVDAEDADEWVKGMDFDALVNALKKTDLPDELVDSLEQAVSAMQYMW